MITIAILIIITIATTATVVEITSGGVGKSRSGSRPATGEILLPHSLGKTPSLGWMGQYLVKFPNYLDR